VALSKVVPIVLHQAKAIEIDLLLRKVLPKLCISERSHHLLRTTFTKHELSLFGMSRLFHEFREQLKHFAVVLVQLVSLQFKCCLRSLQFLLPSDKVLDFASFARISTPNPFGA
jgi:hypothetical protein